MTCLILQVYFLLPKLCLTSSYEPGMTCHWVTPHFSCTASSAAFGPTSSAFCQCYLLFCSLRHKAQAGKWGSEPAHTHGWLLVLLGHLRARLGCTRRLALCWPGVAGGCWAAPHGSYGTHRGQVKTLVLNCIKSRNSRCRQRLWRAKACFDQHAVPRSQICTKRTH